MKINSNTELTSTVSLASSSPGKPVVKGDSELPTGMLIAWVLIAIGALLIVVRMMSNKRKEHPVSNGNDQICKEKITDYFNKYYVYCKHRHIISYDLMYSLHIDANEKSEEFRRILSLQDLGISYNDGFEIGYKFLAFLADSQEVSAWSRSLDIIYRTIEAIAEIDIIKLVQGNHSATIKQEYLAIIESRKTDLQLEIGRHPNIAKLLISR